MVARYVGSSLGLLAFAVAAIGGLYAENPPYIILSRSVLALFLFCAIGLGLGYAAQLVIDEHAHKRRKAIDDVFRQAEAEIQDRESGSSEKSDGMENETAAA